ncbi:AAA family ATPase [Novipirellula caenicola]|uniref:ATPase AAA-type core domain-containing protein n=1 Tax=Novipirellula caenicola TaxID=1536901 RepID=A0ABP9VY50_9BACT
MKYQVISSFKGIKPKPNYAYLVEDTWDDWFEFSTQYGLYVFDSKSERHQIGDVKIGQYRMKEDQRRPNISSKFDSLDKRFFSLGQDASYYENLNTLKPEVRTKILIDLNDLALNPTEINRAKRERVTTRSLLRSIPVATVRNQFHRMTKGGARLTRYDFAYTPATRAGTRPLPVALQFNVVPESNPPSNIHVLIGRNGVGKTHTLSQMTSCLVGNSSGKSSGAFIFNEDFGSYSNSFANLVSVSFSAFDSFIPPTNAQEKESETEYCYIGLKRSTGGKYSGRPKSPQMLTNEFVKAIFECMTGARQERWQNALQTLEADPIFKEADVASLATFSEDQESFKSLAEKLFEKLSSGHKIVLLTMTRLVETVSECTLILLDEPEAHLHPPLLSAFIRALSDLLTNQNGVAIIATHSPVILQEVPSNCVWKLQRTGFALKAERPECETFGENVGVLTSEVFGLEVTHSGFHKMLREAVDKGLSYKAILRKFDDSLGGEARAIAMSLTALRDSKED